MSPELCDVLALSDLKPREGTRLSSSPSHDGRVTELRLASEDGLPGVHLEVDLGDAVGYWHPGHRTNRALPPDWLPASVTSLVESAPVGALYNAAGETLLGWAADEAVAELRVDYGVSEERKTFVVDIRPVAPLEGDLVIVVDRRREPVSDSIPWLARWMSNRCVGPSLSPPQIAREPVYSTWYTFAQDIDAELVTSEAVLATELGCRSIFIDDGWQRFAHGRGYQGCGDWLPDASKFPDLAGTVKTIHATGASVALWVAPLLLGQRSTSFPHLYPYAPHWEDDLSCHVLDPRYPQVRDHVADLCLRLVCDYNVDLLKIDFLDQAMAYRDSPCGGDIGGVGEAMSAMLGHVRTRLADAGRPDVAFEFRQPYVSPAIARFGEILRANDCPGDSVINRTASIDARLLAVGQVVHADPMMWGPAAGAGAVAQQLYAGWFAVPQISMRLSELSGTQAHALRALLSLWRDHSDVTLRGEIRVSGPERGYDLVTAVRRDLHRSVLLAYAPVTIDLDVACTSEVTVVNATPFHGLVVRTTRALAGGVISSVLGETVTALTPTSSSLLEVAVPPFGSATLLLNERHGG